MVSINTAVDFDPLPIKPQLDTDEPIKHHPANLFFNLCVTCTTADFIQLTATLRTPMSDRRSLLGLVVDCAAQLLGWHALGVSELLEYELNFHSDFDLEPLSITTRLNQVGVEYASFHCSISIAEHSQPRLIADASGTLIHWAPDK